ncbi:MAG: serine/threonine protein kinase, partial [Candidatus Binatia bacterium]
MGQVISNKYEVISELGRGGMGVVYKVRHSVLGKTYALKVLPAELMMANQDLVTRFYREARVMARLTHANIVQVMDIDRDESRDWYYFVMEYVQGKSLKHYIKSKGPLPLPEVLEIGCQVARALVYAHRQSPPVIHRDIKPENIMIEEPRRRVVVLDFGIAKQLEAGSQFTVAGTPKYCAPEQLLG